MELGLWNLDYCSGFRYSALRQIYSRFSICFICLFDLFLIKIKGQNALASRMSLWFHSPKRLSKKVLFPFSVSLKLVVCTLEFLSWVVAFLRFWCIIHEFRPQIPGLFWNLFCERKRVSANFVKYRNSTWNSRGFSKNCSKLLPLIDLSIGKLSNQEASKDF